MDYLILAFVGFVAALTPGPDIFYVIRQGLCNGIKNSLIAVAGILSGNIVYLSLVYLGLGTIGKNPYFQLIVGILGAIYLFRIAVIIFNEKVNIKKECDITKNIYKEALFLNLSNPKAMIFFAVVVTPFLSKNIMLSFLALFMGIALAFLTGAIISSKINLEEKLLNTINKIASVVFVFFAIKLLIIAFEAFKEIF
ncbi:LysE family translocator [Caminibacter pacificus]